MPPKHINSYVNRILCLPAWYPSRRSPQNGLFIKEQIQLLRDEGLYIDLVHADLSYRNWRHHGEYQIAESNHGIDYTAIYACLPRRISIGMRWYRAYYIRLVEDYIKKYGTPAVIHAHHYLAGWVALHFRKKYGVPYILTEHFTGFLVAEGIPAHHRDIVKQSFEGAQFVVAVSRALQDAIMPYLNTPQKVVVIPNFINLDWFVPQPTPTVEEDIFRLLYIGDLITRKRVDLLIEAIVDLPDCTLSVVGGGIEESRLKAQAKYLGVGDRVDFCGPMDNREIRYKLYTHHALVLPSQVETFGIVLLEALACGRPIITHDSHGVGDIWNVEVGELTRTLAAIELQQAIRRLKRRYHQFDAQRLHDYVAANFSPALIADKYRNLYQRAEQQLPY